MIGYSHVTRGRLGEHARVEHTLELVASPTDRLVVDTTDLVVDVDAGRLVRRQVTCSAPYSTPLWEYVREWSTPAAELVAAYVNPNGTTDRQTIFTGYITDARSRRTPGGDDTLRLMALDPTHRLLDLTLDADLDVSGTSALAAIGAQVSAVGLSIASTAGVSDRILGAPTTFRLGDVRARVVDGIVDVLGADLYARADGALVVVTQPATPASSSVCHVLVGPGGAVLNSDSGYSRDDFANRYRISSRYRDGAGAEAIATGSATDTDPGSPTRWDGPAGRRERHDVIDQPVSASDLSAMAATRLHRLIGAGRSITVTCPLALWLEPWDTVTVQLPYGEAWRHLVQRVSHDLGSSLTTFDTRRPLSAIIS